MSNKVFIALLAVVAMMIVLRTALGIMEMSCGDVTFMIERGQMTREVEHEHVWCDWFVPRLEVNVSK